MKFYYRGKGFDCKWKTAMRSDYWYNMEQFSISVNMPMTTYQEIIEDIKLQNAIKISKKKGIEPILRFRILKHQNEKVKWGIYSSDDIELWKISSLLDRISISSEFPNGNVIAKFDLVLDEHNKCDKSEIRELLLNEIL